MVMLPATVLAHAELDTSTPADGATVESPFDGPIVLDFTEALASGSEADLLGPGGAVVATADVDGPGARMTFEFDTPIDPGVYEVRWTGMRSTGTSIAERSSSRWRPPRRRRNRHLSPRRRRRHRPRPLRSRPLR